MFYLCISRSNLQTDHCMWHFRQVDKETGWYVGNMFKISGWDERALCSKQWDWNDELIDALVFIYHLYVWKWTMRLAPSHSPHSCNHSYEKIPPTAAQRWLPRGQTQPRVSRLVTLTCKIDASQFLHWLDACPNARHVLSMSGEDLLLKDPHRWLCPCFFFLSLLTVSSSPPPSCLSPCFFF